MYRNSPSCLSVTLSGACIAIYQTRSETSSSKSTCGDLDGNKVDAVGK